MRVVRIITRLNVGGPTFHVHRLARDHRESGIETHVVCGTPGPGEGDRAESLRADGITVHGVPALEREPSLRRDHRGLRALRSILRELDPDVVHTHQAKAGALGRLAASRARVPAVFHTFHGHVFEGYFSPIPTRLWIGMERWLARRTDRLLVPGPTLLDDLMRFRIAPRDKFESYVQPIDWDAFDEDRAASDDSIRHAREWAAAPADTPRSPVVLGIVGRLVPIKAHVRLFEAIEPLVEHHEIRVLVFGDGPLRDELERAAATRGLSRHVHFVGQVPNGPSLYASLDALVCCSSNEGVPLCVIEARSCGVPVLATDVGGMRDAIDREAGDRLVGPDTGSLERAIRDFIQNRAEARRRCSAARERVRERHDPKRVSRRLADLYREVLSQKRPGSARDQRPGEAIGTPAPRERPTGLES